MLRLLSLLLLSLLLLLLLFLLLLLLLITLITVCTEMRMKDINPNVENWDPGGQRGLLLLDLEKEINEFLMPDIVEEGFIT